MQLKHQKSTSYANERPNSRQVSTVSRHIDLSHRAPVATTRTQRPGNVGHCLNNPANSLLLDSQSLAKIWRLVAPILDEKRKEGAFFIAGYTFRELKKDMKKLFTRIERNTRRVKRIVEHLQECDLYVQ